ncbi:glycosyltransferase family 2 protein [Terrimonas sp. NA20]|uniref:Glycosyltransferase family 2 protein n=1 Tax=Terrimonas ginsenosidimutans TaxID=2908004 RepID=A0ABS9L061_9BACT|nr:glycosyltransferase family 2 protein [Terrimonas ginsenosidimutans]MCG2617959.1 glycosyltransferase family 2 protein [Terrimonas ginsenosidimutans]
MQQSTIVSGVSVVIPNYNGLLLLQDILPAVVIAIEETKLPFEIIISDDCSSDNSIPFLTQEYPDVIILENETNQGFSPTINKGIFKARYSHLLLLNSDVKLEPGYLVHLLRYFDKPDTFGVMGKIIGWDDDYVQDGGKFPSFHGLKIKTSGNYLPVKKESGQWLYSMYLSGAAAFVDRSKVISLGGFNELFAPFYVEDYDLSLRAWRMGWKCYYDDYAVCRHKVSVSIKQSHRKKSIKVVYDRNKMFLHAIHLSYFKRFQWFVQFSFESLAYLFMFRITWLKSLLSFIRHYNGVIESRRNLLKAANGRELLTVNQVVELVRSSVEKNEITRF